MIKIILGYLQDKESNSFGELGKKLLIEIINQGGDILIAYIYLGMLKETRFFSWLLFVIALRALLAKSPLIVGLVIFSTCVLAGVYASEATQIYLGTAILITLILTSIIAALIRRFYMLLFLSSPTYDAHIEKSKQLIIFSKPLIKLIKLTKLILALICPAFYLIFIIIVFAGFFRSADLKDNTSITVNRIYKNEINEELNRFYFEEDSYLNNFNVILNNIYDLWDNDYLYFSAVTYFTVGYGDICPESNNLKMIAILEMIYANLMNLFFFGLFGSTLYEYNKLNKIE